MAELTIEGDELVLTLTTVEKVEAVHGDVRVPVSTIQRVEILDDALDAVSGVRAPGTGIPGVLVVGTIVRRGARAFAVVHHGYPRGVRVQLAGAAFDELIVGCEDPESVAAGLTALR